MLNFGISSNALFAPLRSSESPWSRDCRIRSECSFQRSATRSSATGSTTRRKRWSGELLASLFMQGIFSSFIRARERACPLTANFPRTFSLLFRDYRCPHARVGECSRKAVLTESHSSTPRAGSVVDQFCPVVFRFIVNGCGVAITPTLIWSFEEIHREE